MARPGTSREDVKREIAEAVLASVQAHGRAPTAQVGAERAAEVALAVIERRAPAKPHTFEETLAERAERHNLDASAYVAKDDSVREHLMAIFPDQIFFAHRENIAEMILAAPDLAVTRR